MTAATYRQRLGGDPVKSELVRKVPLDRLLRDHLAKKLPHVRRGRRLIRPGYLEAIYRAARACHVPPTTAVANALGIAVPAAEQRVYGAPSRRSFTTHRQRKG